MQTPPTLPHKRPPFRRAACVPLAAIGAFLFASPGTSSAAVVIDDFADGNILVQSTGGVDTDSVAATVLGGIRTLTIDAELGQGIARAFVSRALIAAFETPSISASSPYVTLS